MKATDISADYAEMPPAITPLPLSLIFSQPFSATLMKVIDAGFRYYAFRLLNFTLIQLMPDT
jgi:hypothetical protein